MNEKGHTPKHAAMKFQNPKARENTIKDVEVSGLQISLKQFYKARPWNNTFKIPREDYFHYRIYA